MKLLSFLNSGFKCGEKISIQEFGDGFISVHYNACVGDCLRGDVYAPVKNVYFLRRKKYVSIKVPDLDRIPDSDSTYKIVLYGLSYSRILSFGVVDLIVRTDWEKL